LTFPRSRIPTIRDLFFIRHEEDDEDDDEFNVRSMKMAFSITKARYVYALHDVIAICEWKYLSWHSTCTHFNNMTARWWRNKWINEWISRAKKIHTTALMECAKAAAAAAAASLLVDTTRA
jgi:hypothetical protein